MKKKGSNLRDETRFFSFGAIRDSAKTANNLDLNLAKQDTKSDTLTANSSFSSPSWKSYISAIRFSFLTFSATLLE